MPRTRNIYFIALASFACLALSACHDPSASASAATPTPAQSDAPRVSVTTLAVQRIDIVDDLSGRLSSVEVADVRPQVDGIVQRRLFTEGATVKAGEPLYQLDAASYQAAYDTARGTLQKAMATSKAADITARRYQDLLKIKGVSEQDVENNLAAADEARADIVTDRGTLETARVNLARTRIVAPINGKIGKSAVTAGALVTADQTTALATIQSMDALYLDVTRSSTEALRLRKALAAGALQAGAAQVNVQTEDGAAYAHPGKLLFSDVTVDATTGSITLRALIPNPEHELMPGMFVQARLDEGEQDALLVPQALVNRGAGGTATVLVVNAANVVESRDVEAEQAHGTDWIVTRGLRAGDRIVTDNLQSISAGMKVTPVETAAKGA
ncbi:efflux RND transporter periplasmic adaptor subunit [Caballeronia sp. LZ035]|uniref:efflux RND transporter periplasmic adaptor subunit n=1 Tax=Caballeronia sp. LZ035 TaxID=3038568 RepID=UPI00286046FE|nr:efflux RND transporter periplasmic adaptor subunit [Caballeronia sp. LZ035]MDR5760517.1 efflux RND transporter periplasmic adaptor subunit [Caballeronia sp. LZ035]